jgi:hypothetical protein
MKRSTILLLTALATMQDPATAAAADSNIAVKGIGNSQYELHPPHNHHDQYLRSATRTRTRRQKGLRRRRG